MRNPYLRNRHNESLAQTLLNTLLVNRLKHLAAEEAIMKLSLETEVVIDVMAKKKREPDSRLLIRGKADWVLGHGESKTTTEPILVVVQAKIFHQQPTGLAQLLLYMCGIRDSRKSKVNKGVFGVLSDSATYSFAYLSPKNKFYLSPPLEWDLHCGEIIFYLDNILRDAIQLSPATTPTRHHNNIVCQYDRYMEERWQFGAGEQADKTSEIGESDGSGKKRKIADEGPVVEVVVKHGEIKLISSG